VEKLLRELSGRLEEHYYSVAFTEKLKDYILESSFSEEFGARPLKRFIQDKIETFLAERIVKEELSTESKYVLDVDKDGHLVLTKPLAN